MKKSTKPSNILFFYSFVTASRNTKGLAYLSKLDPVDERILMELAMSWKDDIPITVLQTMHSCSFISTTTAHRRLTTLRTSGMIKLELDANDNRVKFVVPTEKTIQYFDHLGLCIKNAAVGA